MRTEDVEKLVPGSSGNTKGKERAESESDDEEVEDDLMVVGEGEDLVVEEDAQVRHSQIVGHCTTPLIAYISPQILPLFIVFSYTYSSYCLVDYLQATAR